MTEQPTDDQPSAALVGTAGQQISAAQAAFQERTNLFARLTCERFVNISGSLDTMNDTLSGINAKLDRLNENYDAKFAAINETFKCIDDRLTSFDSNTADLTARHPEGGEARMIEADTEITMHETKVELVGQPKLL